MGNFKKYSFIIQHAIQNGYCILVYDIEVEPPARMFPGNWMLQSSACLDVGTLWRNNIGERRPIYAATLKTKWLPVSQIDSYCAN